MNKYSVLIVDDEPIQRKIMQQYCEQSRFFSSIHQASDAVEALEMLHKFNYHLLLLDINMPLLSGLNLVKTLQANVKVIFVTAYAEHAVEAFELNVIDYLLKPVAFERFIKALQKLVTSETLPENNTADVATTTTEKAFIALKQGKKNLRVKADDILYCEAKGNNTRVFLADETTLDIYIPLTKLLTDLPIADFSRIHRSFIVNNKRIKAIENNQVYIGKATIPIGANFKAAVQKLL